MIRVKLSPPTPMDIADFRKMSFESVFKLILDNTYAYSSDEPVEPPFRDAESIEFLRKGFNAEFVEGDWFSVVTPDGRFCISSMELDVPYGLVLIHNSKLGRYTHYFPAYENTWNALNSLPIDLLVEYSLNDEYFPHFCNHRHIIVNYPHNGETAEAVVPGSEERKAYYKRIREGESLTETFHNGKLHLTDLPTRALRFDWKQHLSEILCSINRKLHRKKLVTFIGVPCNFEYLKTVLWLDDYEIEDIGQYPLEITNHMIFLPDAANCKYPIFVIVTKLADGTFHVFEGCPVKNPTYGEYLSNALECVANLPGEHTVLFVDCPGFPRFPDDISNHALCGFRLSGDQLDLYGKDEALWMFRTVLEEAMRFPDKLIIES